MAIARLATLAALLGGALLLTAGATAQISFEDAVGDQRNIEELVAPDITSVQVSNTPDGVITFRVTIVNQTTLPPHSRIAVLFDLDRRQATGFGGFEYSVKHEIQDSGQPLIAFERWDEVNLEFDQLPTTDIVSEFANGVYTLRVPRRQLENTTLFEFGMYAAALNRTVESRSAVDDAPNAELWSYALAGLPAPRLVTSRLRVAPARPVAGRSFSVGTPVRRSDTGAAITSGMVACTARVGQARVRASGRFTGGQARCVVVVPRTAKGKTLRVTMTIRSAGATVTRTVTYLVG
jgi:hypothetical protein